MACLVFVLQQGRLPVGRQRGTMGDIGATGLTFGLRKRVQRWLPPFHFWPPQAPVQRAYFDLPPRRRTLLPRPRLHGRVSASVPRRCALPWPELPGPRVLRPPPQPDGGL